MKELELTIACRHKIYSRLFLACGVFIIGGGRAFPGKEINLIGC